MEEMKDRIKQLMLVQHMNQQSFSDVLNISPASLSSIFNDRTKPTLNHIDAIKNKFPSINLDWLMYGRGSMFLNTASVDAQSADKNGEQVQAELDFDAPANVDTNLTAAPSPIPAQSSSKPIPNISNVSMKYFDKKERKITEIRVFYDDQTWETFIPKK